MIVDSYIPVLNIITLTTAFVYSLGVLYKNVVQFLQEIEPYNGDASESSSYTGTPAT